MVSATESLSEVPNSVWVRGGDGAPARARMFVLSQLDGGVSAPRAADAALIVSELVTNSVLHAHVGIDEVLGLEVAVLGDHLRISVIDSGSELEPRIRARDPEALSGGYGLRLVDTLSSAWGVARGPAGTTCVWCELPLGGRDQPQREAPL